MLDQSISMHEYTELVKVLGSILSMFWPIGGKSFCSVDLQWAIFSKSNKKEKEKWDYQIITHSECNQLVWLSSWSLLPLKLRFEMPKSILAKKSIFSLGSNVQIFIKLYIFHLLEVLKCQSKSPSLCTHLEVSAKRSRVQIMATTMN